MGEAGEEVCGERCASCAGRRPRPPQSAVLRPPPPGRRRTLWRCHRSPWPRRRAVGRPGAAISCTRATAAARGATGRPPVRRVSMCRRNSRRFSAPRGRGRSTCARTVCSPSSARTTAAASGGHRMSDWRCMCRAPHPAGVGRRRTSWRPFIFPAPERGRSSWSNWWPAACIRTATSPATEAARGNCARSRRATRRSPPRPADTADTWSRRGRERAPSTQRRESSCSNLPTAAVPSLSCGPTCGRRRSGRSRSSILSARRQVLRSPAENCSSPPTAAGSGASGRRFCRRAAVRGGMAPRRPPGRGHPRGAGFRPGGSSSGAP